LRAIFAATAATLRAGEEARFNISLINHGLAPQRGSFAVANAPRVATKNDGAQDKLVTLAAQAPRGFQVVFKEGNGTRELTVIPINAEPDT
jgi:hypothetical protein